MKWILPKWCVPNFFHIFCYSSWHSYHVHRLLVKTCYASAMKPCKLRSSLVVRASDCQCTSCNGPGFDPSIRRHSGIWGAADKAVLNIVRRKNKKSPPQKFFFSLLWIRIRIIFRIRILIKVISWIRIRINLQITSQNVWNMSLFRAFIWELGSGSRSGSGWKVVSGSVSASDKNQDPDPHQT